jgi:hypothetical protein
MQRVLILTADNKQPGIHFHLFITVAASKPAFLFIAAAFILPSCRFSAPRPFFCLPYHTSGWHR